MPEEQIDDQNSNTAQIPVPEIPQVESQPIVDSSPNQSKITVQAPTTQTQPAAESVTPSAEPANNNIRVIQPPTLQSLPPSTDIVVPAKSPYLSDQSKPDDAVSEAEQPLAVPMSVPTQASVTPDAPANPAIGTVVSVGQTVQITEKPRKMNKKIFLVVIISIIVILLGGSSYAAYSWYENPQKVLTDSILNIFSAKTSIYSGTLTSQDDTYKMSIDITAKQSAESTGSLEARLTYTYQGKSLSAKGAVQNDSDGNLYVKFDDLAELVSDLKNIIGSDIDTYQRTPAAVDTFVGQVDGKWIKISSSDLAAYSTEISKAQSCTSDTIDKFKNDKTAIAEVTKLYQNNQFYTVDKQLGLKDGKYNFSIKGDYAKAKSFVKGLSDTKIYKALHDCDGSFTIDPSDLPDETELNNDGTVELQIDMWTHKITRINVDVDSSGMKTSLVLNPKYDQEVKITAPSSSISLTQLKTYIESAASAYEQDMNDQYSS